MGIEVVPHLNFRGEAREALEFYRSVFGGELTIATYKQLGNVQDPADADLVIWGQVAADGGFKVMAFDAPASLPFDRGRNPFYVAARFGTDGEIRAAWDKLKLGGEVRRDLAAAPWGPMLYGMLQDRFGAVWVLDVAPARGAS